MHHRKINEIWTLFNGAMSIYGSGHVYRLALGNPNSI
jgi:hypothetical protein